MVDTIARNEPEQTDVFVIDARSITKTFGPVRALVDVDLAVRPGEIIALAGENGSGKSTLAKVLAGILRPDGGAIRARGAEQRFDSPNDAMRAGIALVSQEPTVVPHLSVAENVLLPRLQRPRRLVRRRQLADQALPYLSLVGLDVDPLQPFTSLRQGERELAEVAKALATEPDLLILDEATSRLPDPERLFTVVERLCADRAMAAVVITHRLREIRRVCQRAVVLRDGRRVGELGPDELTDERISSMMVGRELSDFYDKPQVDLGDTVLRVTDLVTDRSPHHISLTVRTGEIVGVAGLVGSGRSELLETIAGVRHAHHGSVVVGGTPLDRNAPIAAIKSGISLVPEDRWSQGLVRHHSIASNLTLSRHRFLGRTSRRDERRRAQHAIDRFGIRCWGAEAPVGSLSGGNAQKVVLARGIDQAPKVLLLDEPTRGVDIGAKAEIYHVIHDLVSNGVGALLASSDLLELLALCDRILVLHEGRLVGELSRAEATEESIALLSAGGARNT